MLTDARRPWRTAGLAVLGAYLAATLLPLSVNVARGSAGEAMLAAHIAVFGVVVFGLRSRDENRWVGLIAVALIPFMYAELRALIPPTASMHDSVIQRWEASLFGISPALVLARRFPSLFASELLHLAYLSYYAIIFAPPLIAFWHRDEAVFDATVLGMMIVFAGCFLTFVAFPVEGPRYLWPAPEGIVSGPIRRLVLAILASGSSRGTAFPSSHVAVAVAQSVMALAWQPKLGRWIAAAALLLSIGTVYGGFHYAVDALVGAAVGLVIGVAVISRAWARLGLPAWGSAPRLL